MATTAALVARARRNVIAHFLRNNAVAPDRAILCLPDRGREMRALARFMDKGVLVQTAPDTYYLDAPAYERWQQAFRRKLIAIAAIIVILAFALGAFLR